MTRRCVVTGQDAKGNSVIVSDTQLEPIVTRPGAEEMYRVWGGDEIQKLPHDGTKPDPPLMFPPPGGFRFVFTTMPPQSVMSQPVSEEKMAEIRATTDKLGTTNLYEPDRPGVHTTDTIDFDVIISGEVYCELDEGEVLLKAGDCLIQNGTRHKWSNRGTEPVVMLASCIGAERT